MNWYNIIIIRHIEKFNYDPLKVDSSRAMVVGQNTIYIYVCGVYLYLHTVHTANTTCCGHIVINIIYIYIYTHIFVITLSGGGVAHWHSGLTSAPPGDEEHCGETPAECLVFLYYVSRAQTMLQYYYFVLVVYEKCILYIIRGWNRKKQ